MGKECYRVEVEQLIQNQKRPKEAFLCSQDGKPCSNPDRFCEEVAGGTDVEQSILWRCPRFPPGGSGDKFTMFFTVPEKKKKEALP
jgi:hypothetical protein